MKKECVLLIFLILTIPLVSAFSFSDFIENIKNNIRKFFGLSPKFSPSKLQEPPFSKEPGEEEIEEPIEEDIEPDEEFVLPAEDFFNKEAKQRKINNILEFGEDIIISGILEVLVIDDFENSRSVEVYFLRADDGERYKVYPPEGTDLILPGKRLQIAGKILNNEIVLIDYIVEPGQRTYLADDNLGEQRTAFILVNFLDGSAPLRTPAEAVALMNTVDLYMREASYNKAWFNIDVFGYYTLNINGAECNDAAIRENVFNSPIIDQDIDWTQYDRIIISWTHERIAECSGVGWAHYGSPHWQTADGEIRSSLVYLNGPNFAFTPFTVAHELGHTFGVGHANDLECGTLVIGDNCEIISYGDLFSTMGNQGDLQLNPHYNARHKETIGWFDPSNVVYVTSDGTYTIWPLENPGPQVKMLKIHSPNNISIEYRRPIGFDTGNSNDYGTGIYDGVMLHIADRDNEIAQKTFLLDNSPHTDEEVSQFTDSIYVVLPQGSTFVDPLNGLSITTTSITSDFAQVSVSNVPYVPQCSDNIDNDNDGATDYPNDFSCSGPDDNDETNPKAQCQDGLDNECDQWQYGYRKCDFYIDYPNDPDCTSTQDNTENQFTHGLTTIHIRT